MAVAATDSTRAPQTPLPDPQDNVKPDNYVDKFKVRAFAWRPYG